MYFRLLEVDQKIGRYIACPGCFDAVVIANDLLIFGLVTGILLLASWLRPERLSRSVQVLAGVPVIMYLVDYFLFHLFHTRLFMTDAAMFVNEWAAIWDQFHSGVGGHIPTLGILAGTAFLLFLLYRLNPLRQRPGRIVLAVLLGVFLLVGVLVEKPPYVNRWAVDNVITANLISGSKKEYSPQTISRVQQAVPAMRRMEAPAVAAHRPDVIMVLLESWSSWHSALFGGHEDWTPELDKAARQGLRYTRFHAIGFSTDKGLMGILAGVPLWAPFIHWYQATPFHSTWGVEKTLPRAFTNNGYRASFLTTGPREVYRKGEWLEELGFDYVEGREHPFYEDKPRYAFKAASDRALYQRAEQWRETAESPYFLVLETVTTHQPYQDPDSGEKSLEKAMKFADRAFGEYLQNLQQGGFFANGLLVVVSDHRSMTPISAEEYEQFGLDAYSRVPMFIIGEGFEADSIDERVFSQSDIAPSFDWWLDGRVVLEPFDRIMLNSGLDPAATACALHARGNERGLVNVICPAGEGVVAMEGDETRFIESHGLEASRQSEIIDEIARIRLRGLERHQRLLERRQQEGS